MVHTRVVLVLAMNFYIAVVSIHHQWQRNHSALIFQEKRYIKTKLLLSLLVAVLLLVLCY